MTTSMVIWLNSPYEKKYFPEEKNGNKKTFLSHGIYFHPYNDRAAGLGCDSKSFSPRRAVEHGRHRKHYGSFCRAQGTTLRQYLYFRNVLLRIDKTSTWVEYEVVRQAEIVVAGSVPYVGIFDTYGFATDGMHYKSSGLVAMGEAFASSMLALLAGGATPAPTFLPGMLGDVNADSRIDIVDALLVARYYVGLNPANFDPTRADVNGNGSIDIVDALRIAQFYVGLITGF
jgi:hypothetical protein